MKKLYITLIGIIFLIGIVVSYTQISESISFDKEQKDILNQIGITNPIISPCIKQDEYTCKANIYEKDGINKEIEIITKYCDEYEIIYSDGECLNWTDENQTKCLIYEIIETQGNCSIWKELSQSEIEIEMKKTTESLLSEIVDIQESRNKIKEVLTDEISIEIKEGIGKIIK